MNQQESNNSLEIVSESCTKCRDGNYEFPFNELELARAYVPSQRAENMLPPEMSLIKGTVFPELYRAYCSKELI